MKAVTGHLWAKWNENSNDERKFETLTRQTEPVFFEGGVRGVRKQQNRTEIRKKTENRIGFFPEYRNRAYM